VKEAKLVRTESGRAYKNPLLGQPLHYDQGYGSDGRIPGGHNTRTGLKNWVTPGDAAKWGGAYGLPPHVRAKLGSQLGCGCQEAHLHAVGDINSESLLEADYMCSYGYHNYYVFEVEQEQADSPRAIKLDLNGNMIEDEDEEEPKKLQEL
jgi:hypothetical protein